MESQDEPTIMCSNWYKNNFLSPKISFSEKHIPESKSFLHEAYCLRNIIKCPKCNEPIHKAEVDAHNKEAHELVTLHKSPITLTVKGLL